jgi:hypothetical protein
VKTKHQRASISVRGQGDFLRARENRGGRMTCDAGREGLSSCDVEWPPLPGVVRCCRVGCGPDVAPGYAEGTAGEDQPRSSVAAMVTSSTGG